MNYYPHHIGDFDRATRHLTRIERSIYRDMLDLYYESENQLPLDISALCRKIVARSEEEKSAVLAVLDEFFHETPTGWFHDRCEEELAEYRKTKSQASAAGKASAAARAQRRQEALQTALAGNEVTSGGSTTVQRPFNDRSTEGQRKPNEQPTNQEPRTKNQINTPKPPKGGLVPADEDSTKSRGTTLQAFLDVCKAKGERPVADYKSLWEYCASAGLDRDYVALAWVEFVRRYTGGGTKPRKLQKDWRATFRNYVENNYFKLWAIDANGQYFLTSQGRQAQKVHEARESAPPAERAAA